MCCKKLKNPNGENRWIVRITSYNVCYTKLLRLKAGDVLLLLAGENFTSRLAGEIDFYLISKVKELHKPEKYKIWVLFGGTLLAIFLSAIKVAPLFMGLIMVLAAINILGIVSAKELPKSIDYNLGVIIALSLALGTAMIKTGVAEMIANFVISVFLPFGDVSFVITSYSIHYTKLYDY